MKTEDERNYIRLFMPSALDRQDYLKKAKLRFAYYTTATTAVLAIRNREIWMRSLMVMNDYSEVEHGLRCVVAAFNSSEGDRFRAALDRAFPGLAKKVIDNFNSWMPALKRSTFVACLSEHEPEDDTFGRLSMWRAYGGDAGVALVVKPDFMDLQTDALGAFTSPVAYLNDHQVHSEVARVAAQLEANTELLLKFGADAASGMAFEMLRFAAICTKHPAFLEEREWRILACPDMHPKSILQKKTEFIGGIPQPVLKLHLRDQAEHGLIGLEINKLIDKVLIGPCEHAEVIYQSILEALSEAGIEDPQHKIVHTGVPLRPNQR